MKVNYVLVFLIFIPFSFSCYQLVSFLFFGALNGSLFRELRFTLQYHSTQCSILVFILLTVVAKRSRRNLGAIKESNAFANGNGERIAYKFRLQGGKDVLTVYTQLILLLRINKKAYEGRMDVGGITVIPDLKKIRQVFQFLFGARTTRRNYKGLNSFREIFSNTRIFFCSHSSSGLERQKGGVDILHKSNVHKPPLLGSRHEISLLHN